MMVPIYVSSKLRHNNDFNICLVYRATFGSDMIMIGDRESPSE